MILNIYKFNLIHIIITINLNYKQYIFIMLNQYKFYVEKLLYDLYINPYKVYTPTICKYYLIIYFITNSKIFIKNFKLFFLNLL